MRYRKHGQDFLLPEHSKIHVSGETDEEIIMRTHKRTNSESMY